MSFTDPRLTASQSQPLPLGSQFMPMSSTGTLPPGPYPQVPPTVPQAAPSGFQDASVRPLDASRVLRGDSGEAAASPPAMFTTGPIPQMMTQDSAGTFLQPSDMPTSQRSSAPQLSGPSSFSRLPPSSAAPMMAPIASQDLSGLYMPASSMPRMAPSTPMMVPSMPLMAPTSMPATAMSRSLSPLRTVAFEQPAAAPRSMPQLPASSAASPDPQENTMLAKRIEDLERNRLELEQQLFQARSQQQNTTESTREDVATLQRRLQEAEASEETALRAHEARVQEISKLERQINDMQGQQDRNRVQDIENRLTSAQAAEAQSRNLINQQSAKIEEQAREIERARQAGLQAQSGDDPRLEGMQAELQRMRSLEDEYQQQLHKERKRVSDLENKLDHESYAKDQYKSVSQENQQQLETFKNEIAYLKMSEAFHKRHADTHRTEASRLKRLRDQDKPPPKHERMPLKVLEEKLMNLAVFMMLGVCGLPILGAIACLGDENYVFWLGRTWPWTIIWGCVAIFILFVATLQGLYAYALPEHRSQFTMAFTWATFAALLGVLLVPVSLMANREAMIVAGTVSQGCMTANPTSEMLVDYSQVLYNIRLQPSCMNKGSVEECDGFAVNTYTEYLKSLEEDMQCGPLCPEAPPPARAVIAPKMYNNVPRPAWPKPSTVPAYGPPLQNALGGQDPLNYVPTKGSFLQEDSFMSKEVKLHSHEAVGNPNHGIMETALPHMQAKKLFSKGNTRMSCYPLIATRLQVLVHTFGGLWYWEGMGLIIISLLTSLYAGVYFASGL